MNSTGHMVYGNLALAAYPVERPKKVRLSVVEGGRRPRCGVAGASQARAKTAPHGAVAFAVICATALFALVAIVGWSVMSNRSAFVRDSFAGAPLQEVTVHAGDSLWTIAEEYPLDNVTTSELSDAIAAYNALDGVVLNPGDTLMVPASSQAD